MANTTQKDFHFTLEAGATWGTAAWTAPTGLPTSDMPITMEPSVHMFNRARGLRGQHEADTWVDTEGKIPSASLGVLMTPDLMEALMPGVLQAVTPWAADANQWTLFTQLVDEIPTPATEDDGYFYTLSRVSPEADKSVQMASAIPSSVKLSIDPSANEGALFGEFEFTGKGYSNTEDLDPDDVTQAALTYLYKWSAITDVDYGGTDLTGAFLKAEWNISNGAKLTQDNPNGEVAFPMWEVTVTISIMGGAAAEALKALIRSNTINAGAFLNLTFGAGTTTLGDAVISVFCYPTGESINFDDTEVVDFTFSGVFGDVEAGTPEYMLTLLFGDAAPA